MILGENLNFECPSCKNIMSKQSLLSGNTFGAKLYSDGKQIAPMLPESPIITKCNKCETIFWLDSKTETEQGEPDDINWANFLTIDELFFALGMDENKVKENELGIRRMIWWTFNDRFRNGEKSFNNEDEKILWKENINRLLPLIDNSIIEERIMIAELHRNIGNFEKCQNIIDTLPKDRFSSLINLFNKQIRKKNTLLFEIN